MLVQNHFPSRKRSLFPNLPRHSLIWNCILRSIHIVNFWCSHTWVKYTIFVLSFLFINKRNENCGDLCHFRDIRHQRKHQTMLIWWDPFVFFFSRLRANLILYFLFSIVECHCKGDSSCTDKTLSNSILLRIYCFHNMYVQWILTNFIVCHKYLSIFCWK